MWLIKNDILFSIPDDAPQPRGTTRIELPEDFHANPDIWAIKAGSLVRTKPVKRAPAGLSLNDIGKIKAAIAAGKL
jgi:hypothetical protein